ncbi:Glycoside hydrolase, catalytic domain and Glycoside hydrolase, superfamily domain-containing protein [Strongyloides ratti]|uniref:Glycoside hydrolase, catalytic domain and Glycoside hydrolase, superfamily domain-containing protein n=1 Tax=Strongyloides ratti TaxID=34506 RepID=A0A090MZI7_STRRB|nr:Glycoside hydrolase, catalytic domain and Glycoside hydrolase, superfamily domain-containing protein [Strongyloides ratti]CEF69004.1 Glycoside hydrolase, catalytic domain and Glycoside hydrolase, superfamily domain-containing protein [Strongyloides ratti]
MKFFLLILLVIFSIFENASSITGFDAIGSISTTTMKCIKEKGYEFFIGRVWRSMGSHDAAGIENIKNAVKAGYKHVDGYFFPCTTSRCSSAKTQVEEAHKELNKAGAKIGTLWMDIERYEWPSDKAKNRRFILELVKEAEKLGFKVGIYSSYYEWDVIAGADWNGGLNRLPLWWPDYDNEKSFKNFKPFGGFKPSIKQYNGDKNGPCGVNMDFNWY